WDHAELVEVPRLLDEVSGALRILDLHLPADYLHGVKRYTEVELIGRKRVPNSKQLDTMADALASVEYYLEALREQRPNRERILEIARHSLESLGYWPLPDESTATATSPSPVSFEDQDNAAAALGMGPASTPEAKREEEAATAPSEQPTTGVSTPDGEPDRGEAPAPETAPTPAPAPAPAPTGGADGFEHSDDIDDEIREVFLEELEEEITNLGNLLGAWKQAPESME